MSGSFLIYGLIDPTNQQLRYIGLSTQGMIRPKTHMFPSTLKKNENPRKCNWVRKILALGMRPEIVVFEYCSDVDSLQEAEEFYIGYYRCVGANLLNYGRGGTLGRLGVKCSKETKEKMSLSKKGKRLSEHHKELLKEIGNKPDAILSNSRRQGGTSVLCSDGIVYITITEAAKKLNISDAHIYEVLSGKRKHTKGYTFKRVNDDGTEIKQE